MRILVLVIDRLHLGYLGCYGNAWVGTQHFDQLASQSFLFDQAIVDSPDLDSLYRSFWQGTHAACSLNDPSADNGVDARHREALFKAVQSLPASLHATGMNTTLVSDEPRVLSHALAAEFEEIVRIESPVVTNAAGEISETALVQFFASAIETVQASGPDSLTWLHSRGLAGVWDAPSELRAQFADEDDPTPAEFVEPPQIELPEGFDPDVLLGIRQAYAGQIAVLDTCIGALIDAVELVDDSNNESSTEQTAVILLSARGQALGEHRQIGDWDHELHADTVHVPYLVRMPYREGAMMRTSALVQPADWYPTILALAGGTSPEAASIVAGQSLLPLITGDQEILRDRALSTLGDRRALRTPAWSIIWDTAAAAPPKLYVQPDDRWEINEVSDRGRDIPDRLIEASKQFLAVSTSPAASTSSASLPALDAELAEGFA